MSSASSWRRVAAVGGAVVVLILALNVGGAEPSSSQERIEDPELAAAGCPGSGELDDALEDNELPVAPGLPGYEAGAIADGATDAPPEGDANYLPVNRWGPSTGSALHTRLGAKFTDDVRQKVTRDVLSTAILTTGNAMWQITASLVRFASQFDILVQAACTADTFGATIGDGLLGGNSGASGVDNRLPDSGPRAGIIPALVAIAIVSMIWRAARHNENPTKKIAQMLVILVIFGVLLAGANASVRKGEARPFSPGYTAVLVDRAVSIVGEAPTAALANNVPGATVYGPSGDENTADPLSCSNYVSGLRDRYRGSGGDNPGSSVPLAVSAMWEQSGLPAFIGVQYGTENPYGARSYCRLLEDQANISVGQQRGLTGEGVSGAADDGLEGAGDSRIWGDPADGGIDNKKEDQVGIFWAACTFENGLSTDDWVVRGQWKDVEDPITPEDCASFFDDTGGDGFEWDSSSDQVQERAADAPQVRDFMLNWHGDVVTNGLVLAIVFAIAAFIIMLVLGALAVGIIVAKLISVVMIVLIFVMLAVALIPSRSEQSKLGKFVKFWVGMTLFSTLLSLILSLVAIITAFINSFGTLGFGPGSVASLIWLGLSPVTAIIIIHVTFKQAGGLPSPFKPSSALAYGAAIGGSGAAVGVGLDRMAKRGGAVAAGAGYKIGSRSGSGKSGGKGGGKGDQKMAPSGKSGEEATTANAAPGSPRSTATGGAAKGAKGAKGDGSGSIGVVGEEATTANAPPGSPRSTATDGAAKGDKGDGSRSAAEVGAAGAKATKGAKGSGSRSAAGAGAAGAKAPKDAESAEAASMSRPPKDDRSAGMAGAAAAGMAGVGAMAAARGDRFANETDAGTGEDIGDDRVPPPATLSEARAREAKASVAATNTSTKEMRAARKEHRKTGVARDERRQNRHDRVGAWVNNARAHPVRTAARVGTKAALVGAAGVWAGAGGAPIAAGLLGARALRRHRSDVKGLVAGSRRLEGGSNETTADRDMRWAERWRHVQASSAAGPSTQRVVEPGQFDEADDAHPSEAVWSRSARPRFGVDRRPVPVDHRPPGSDDPLAPTSATPRDQSRPPRPEGGDGRANPQPLAAPRHGDNDAPAPARPAPRDDNEDRRAQAPAPAAPARSAPRNDNGDDRAQPAAPASAPAPARSARDDHGDGRAPAPASAPARPPRPEGGDGRAPTPARSDRGGADHDPGTSRPPPPPSRSGPRRDGKGA